MDVMALTDFVWNAMSSGVIGNATYDGLKVILDKGFTRLTGYTAGNQRNEFEAALQMLLETNVELRERLEQLASGTSISGKNNITGTISAGGHVIVGDNNTMG